MKSVIAALRSLVLPFGATSGPRIILDGVNGQISINTAGTTRIVLGANTPPELITFGVSVALLFYVTDSVTGVEVGYFFIGLSNVLDNGGDNIVLLNGQCLYPIPGDPTSPTHSDVKTNYQMNMVDPNSTNGPGTYFKDFPIIVQTTVSRISMGAPTTIVRDNHDLGGGWVAGDTITSDNPPVVAAGDVVQLTMLDEFGNTPTFRAGRAYEARLSCGLQTDAATNGAVIMRLRKTNAAGQLMGSTRFTLPLGGFYYGCTYTYSFQVGAADISAPMTICLQGLAGRSLKMVATDDVARCNIFDIGPANGSRNAYPVLV